jgi:hypothetical protein
MNNYFIQQKPKGGKTKNLTIRIPESLYQEIQDLKAIAQQNGQDLPINYLVALWLQNMCIEQRALLNAPAQQFAQQPAQQDAISEDVQWAMQS